MKYPVKYSKPSYPLSKSPFYRLCSISYLKRILEVCVWYEEELLNEIEQFYSCYDSSGHQKRFPYPIDELYGIHNKIASYLARMEMPEYIHSSKKGASYLTNAQVHQGTKETFKTDIRSFFQSTTKAMVFKFFRKKMLCSRAVSEYLAHLCTLDNALPLGSQVSMRLAYFANMDMFEQLFLLAQSHNLRMSVYVDDITFSGDKIPKGFKGQVAQIVHRHGHKIKRNKTKCYSQNKKEITGIMIDGETLKLPDRKLLQIHNEFNKFKALLKTTERDKEKILYKTRYLFGLLNHAAQFDPKYQLIRKELKAKINEKCGL
ncbi:MAG: reverse transcriptase family protein [Alcaligenaceae bacterium]|nr:reverse transcriptase family protein [Alcaligenaceae bacterium]